MLGRRVAQKAAMLVGAVILVTSVMQERPASAEPPLADSSLHKVVVIGDSYTGGSGAGGVGPAGWPELTWSGLRSEGIELAPEVSGRGGSGYVTRGTEGTTFPDEAARLITPDDRAVVFFGGLNDASVDPAVLSNAVHQTLGVAATAAPCARLIVVAPASPTADLQPSILMVRDVLRDQASQFSAVFVDPIADRWLMDNPETIGFDGVHPNDAGHIYISERLEPVFSTALHSGPAC